MSRLPIPIKHVLRDPDDRMVERGWQRLEAARAESSRRAGWAGRRLFLGASLLAAAAAVVLLFRAPARQQPGGALTLADGTPLPTVVTAAAAPVSLNDGSRLELAADSQLHVSQNERARFETQLLRGQIVFDVRPGTGRAWGIEVGPVRIEVLGTRFTVRRTETSVHVAVDRGRVRVQGEPVPERQRTLGAGEAIEVTWGQDPSIAQVAPGPKVEERPAANPAPKASPARRPPPRPPAPVRTVAALLAEADAARRAGRPQAALSPLREVLTNHRHDPDASLAAFTLGRIELDTFRRPRQAAAAFREAIDLGAPVSLQEDAHARLVEALARAADGRAAREAAAQYESKFPRGKRLAEVKSWAAAAP